jgi:hypothetical protein
VFDRKRAAEYLVVAWCKEWTLGTYLDVIAEENVHNDLRGKLEVLTEQFPWLPAAYAPYHKGVRDVIAGAYPKLSDWLWSRKTDAERLKCAPQIERLKCHGLQRGYVSAADRAEMVESRQAESAASSSYRLSRAAFKTNQRSAWNVCKA